MFSGKSLAWMNGEWMEFAGVRLPLDDMGVMQGVVVVDRLRTIRHKPLDLLTHLQRWRSGCQNVGIELPNIDFEPLVEQLVEQNRTYFQQEDFSVVMLATPGRSFTESRQATVILHATSIPWSKLAVWYQRGQRLWTTGHHAVPELCWPTAIKTRARLHYYLADQQAQLQSGDPNCSAVLLAPDGTNAVTLTETSTANLLMVERDATRQVKLTSPPKNLLLDGISLRRTLRLAKEAGYAVHHEPISIERAEQADELILTGSTGCIWPAAGLNSHIFSDAAQQPVYQTLLAAWQRELDYDFTQFGNAF